MFNLMTLVISKFSMHLSLYQRYQIIFLHQDKHGPRMTLRETATTVGCSVDAVKYWLRRFEEDKDLSNQPASGRPRSTSISEDNEIVQIAISKKHPSSREIASTMSASGIPLGRQTVLCRLHEARLKFQKVSPKPLLKPDQLQKRLDWALQHQYFDWSSCVFTDETAFQLFHDPGKFWQAAEKKLVYRTIKHPQKIHVWGCFSAQGFGKLYLFQRNLDARLMTTIYEKSLLPSVPMLFKDPSEN